MSIVIELLTNSRMACFRTCQWKHYLDYELYGVGIEPIAESSPLRLGHVVHDGLDLIARGMSYNACLDQYIQVPAWAASEDDIIAWMSEAARASAMLDGYVNYWHDAGIEIVASELQFALPIRPPGAIRGRRGWRLAGKIDKIIRLADGRLALYEHKTTSSDIGDSSSYWDNLRLDYQVGVYAYAARCLGYNIETIIYDVLRKPGIAMLRATPNDKRKYTKEGKLYANQRDQDETIEEYSARLRETVSTAPESYYARKELTRLADELALVADEADQIRGMIVHCRKHRAWPRNTAACLRPYRCQYYNLCSVGTNPEAYKTVYGTLPDGYRKSDSKNPELETCNDDRRYETATVTGTQATVTGTQATDT